MGDQHHTVSFTLDVPPVAKARPRVTSRGTYTPDKTRAFEEVVRVAALKAMREAGYQPAPQGTPVGTQLTFRFPMPKSWSKKKRREMPGLHAQRPDIENLMKGVLDACNGVVYHDDGQVASASVQKQWAHNDDGPYVYAQFNWTILA